MSLLLRRLLYAVTAAYWLICAYMTHAPVPRTIESVGSDKFKHLIGYGLLATLLYLSLATTRLRRLQLPLLVLLLLAVYAAFDELTQPPFGRTADFRDFLADLAGIVLATGALTLLRGAFLPPRTAPPA